MNKEIKKKIIMCIICLVLGLGVLFTTLVLKENFTEAQIDYSYGFATGLIIVSIILLIRMLFALSGIDKGQKFANELQDERLIAINNQASDISLRIIIVGTAIASIICSFLDLPKETMMTSIFVGVSTLIHLITYFIVSKIK